MTTLTDVFPHWMNTKYTKMANKFCTLYQLFH